MMFLLTSSKAVVSIEDQQQLACCAFAEKHACCGASCMTNLPYIMSVCLQVHRAIYYLTFHLLVCLRSLSALDSLCCHVNKEPSLQLYDGHCPTTAVGTSQSAPELNLLTSQPITIIYMAIVSIRSLQCYYYMTSVGQRSAFVWLASLVPAALLI